MVAEVTASRGLEEQVLVLCARPVVPRESLARIRELTKAPFDWTRLVGLSEEHGLWPVVYTHVTAAGAGMPAEAAAHLAQRLVETTAVNLALCGQLTEILATLTRAGIPAVAWKGPVLANAYGHIGIRPFSDLDVLVPRRRASDAVEALGRDGYRPADQYSVAHGVYPSAGREYVLVPDRTDRVVVEIQVDLSNWPLPVGLPVDDLIERARVVSIGGRRITALSVEDQVLSLAIHGTCHGWNSLRFISDLHAAASEPIDWKLVHARGWQARIARMLNVGLVLAHEVLDSRLPPTAIDVATADRAAVRLARQLASRLLSRDPARYPHLGEVSVGLQSRERVADKMRYLARTVAFERVIRPIDEWRSVGPDGTAWRAAKIMRRVAIPLLLAAVHAASRTARPIAIGSLLAGVLIAAYIAVHMWAARRVPVRTWSSRNA
jgi:hypothetical protein